MSERRGKIGSGDNCDPDGDCDLELVEKILRMIERHHRDKLISPNIRSLRNTMLAVSALLHLEEIKTYGQPDETFDEAANKQLASVAEAAAGYCSTKELTEADHEALQKKSFLFRA
jgi:hypothetical protein